MMVLFENHRPDARYRRQEVCPTVAAKYGTGGNNAPLILIDGREYDLRRITPTECARLQGFPDDWGKLPVIEDMTDEEARLWQDVFDTQADVNGRKPKKYTKKQLIRRYNKLYSDSAEYEMWGNGIALPNALYIMENIAKCFEVKE